MPEKELNYLRSRDAAEGSLDKEGGVIVDAFEKEDGPQLKGWAKFTDSFKRVDTSELDPTLTEAQKIAVLTANSPLSRSLKNRHLQMIAIGGSIGTGLFIGSGSALSTGGPAGVMIAFVLIGSMMYCTVQSLGELAVTFPVSGAFITYNNRFIDPSWGFSMAWNYAMAWLIILPLELVGAAITIEFWDKTINPAAFVVIFYVLIIAINFFGVKGYGEAEFVFSLVKVTAVIGFCILSVVLVCGGGPHGSYMGAHYWYDPGAFAHGFKGVCSVFVTAAFSFGGTELVGLAAAESKNPGKSLPKATKQVFWRITLFYIISLLLVGFLVQYTDPGLLNNSGASASPFVIAIVNAGISGLPSVMNVVIMISVLSVGNSSVFASSRTLAALATSGMAPKFLAYIDKQGRPLMGIIVQSIFGLLCFLAASPKHTVAFNWMLALSGLSYLFTWGSINVCLIRFRRALKVQGRDTGELVFASQVGVIGAYYGAVMNALVIIAQFWIAVWPIGGKPNAYDFFEAFLSAPVILVSYLGHKIYVGNWTSWYIRAKDIDIDVGRRELDLELVKQEVAEQKAYVASKPFYKRAYYFWC